MNEQGSGHVDVLFTVVGREVTADHGYALYGAISGALRESGNDRWFHDSAGIGLISIRGTWDGRGTLRLSRNACFGLRLPADGIPRILPLAGKRLEVGGGILRVGAVSVRPLRTCAALYARIVTTRNGSDESRFDREVARQLAALGIGASVVRGRRRIIAIRGRKVVGHELTVGDLEGPASIRLQEAGVGGRRKMGCGVFVPAANRGSV